jgi:hypothetical protein
MTKIGDCGVLSWRVSSALRLLSVRLVWRNLSFRLWSRLWRVSPPYRQPSRQSLNFVVPRRSRRLRGVASADLPVELDRTWIIRESAHPGTLLTDIWLPLPSECLDPPRQVSHSFKEMEVPADLFVPQCSIGPFHRGRRATSRCQRYLVHTISLLQTIVESGRTRDRCLLHIGCGVGTGKRKYRNDMHLC